MRKQSLVLLFIIGLLIGSNAPAFADYGYKRVTSGSFILRGMFTNGGKLLSSGSFNLYGALSLEQGASKLSGASYNLDFEFPSIIRIPRAESTSAIDSLVATLKQELTSTLSTTDSLVATLAQALTSTPSATITLLATIKQDITAGALSITDAIVQTIKQDITVTLVVSESLLTTLKQNLTSTLSPTISLTASIMQALTVTEGVTTSLIIALLATMRQDLVVTLIATENIVVTLSQALGVSLDQIAVTLVASLKTTPNPVLSILSSLGAIISQDVSTTPSKTLSVIATIMQSLTISFDTVTNVLSITLEGIKGFNADLATTMNLVLTINTVLEQSISGSVSLVLTLFRSINPTGEVAVSTDWVSAMLFIFFLIILVALFAVRPKLHIRRSYS